MEVRGKASTNQINKPELLNYKLIFFSSLDSLYFSDFYFRIGVKCFDRHFIYKSEYVSLPP